MNKNPIKTCNHCGGTGMVVRNICRKCSGEGMLFNEEMEDFPEEYYDDSYLLIDEDEDDY